MLEYLKQDQQIDARINPDRLETADEDGNPIHRNGGTAALQGTLVAEHSPAPLSQRGEHPPFPATHLQGQTGPPAVTPLPNLPRVE